QSRIRRKFRTRAIPRLLESILDSTKLPERSKSIPKDQSLWKITMHRAVFAGPCSRRDLTSIYDYKTEWSFRQMQPISRDVPASHLFSGGLRGRYCQRPSGREHRQTGNEPDLDRTAGEHLSHDSHPERNVQFAGILTSRNSGACGRETALIIAR